MMRQKGSITIYLLLSLLLMLALICTLIEAGRVNCLNAKLRGITFMAADSCFSEFAAEIFEEYGIMALWKSESEITAEFEDYIQENLSFTDLDLYQDAELLKAGLDASAIDHVEMLTDNNGLVFSDQVCDYMKYFLVQEGLSEILSNLELFKSGSKIAEFVDKINSYQDVFLKVGNSVSKIQQNIDRAKSVAYNPKTILGNMHSSMEKYEETQSTIYAADFNIEYWKMNYGKNELETYMDSIIEESGNYTQYAQEAQEAIQVLEEEFEKDKEDCTSETADAISVQLEDLKEKMSGGDDDYYGVEANCEAALSYRQQLSVLDTLTEKCGLGVSCANLLNYKEDLLTCESAFSGYELENLGLNAQVQTVQKEDTGFLSTIGDILSNGLLSAVAGSNISANKADMSEFPSRTVSRKSSGSAGGNVFSTSARSLMMGEYILKHFGNYQEKKEKTVLQYETEYILGGKSSDKENLTIVVRKLLAVRAGLNMISFYQDPEKTAEAETIAVAVLGFTGMPALVAGLKMIIISTWCLAEGLCDLKTLMAGNKIALIKKPYEWTITAVGLKNFSKTVLPAATDDSGLGYQEYLRLLLLMESQSDLAYRTMDLIQANACKNYNVDFRMSECINELEMQAAYHAPQLFSSFLFVRDLIGNGLGDYSFTVRQEYSY